ncbi:hypothetical protein [Streptomyces griseocarneus]|uniref:hypothetical protein n=1 Tax=Streptomyces griseocarneus TaxID=51201 RepID=UPI00167CED4D|nr:hypothetical protein [Streptomyces griseocarneus]MBZ6472421.1 hypothetical protein [Streptomyces griseocarneus]GHG45079.1 hypothetical protein GCM10018779_00710 [Streptomyces griseocarneus]
MRTFVAPLASLLLAGAAGLTFSAPAAAAPTAPAPVAQECPSVCTADYDPVVCRFSNGFIGRFTNECFAHVYACQRNLKILSCARI